MSNENKRSNAEVLAEDIADELCHGSEVQCVLEVEYGVACPTDWETR